MDHKRKEFLRREMLACARQAAAERKYGGPDEAAWLERAARRLHQLGGLMARW